MIDKYPAIILLGAPGVGKGTQGKLLAQNKNYFHFSSGEMFRNLDAGTDLGSRVKNLIDKGNFIDDQTTINLTKETLSRYMSEKRYDYKKQLLLLDGIPRTIPQADYIEHFIDVKQIIYFSASKEISLKRLNNRAILENRKDDSNQSVLEKRWQEYIRETFPLLERYRSELLVTIEADCSIEGVGNKVKAVILKRENGHSS